MKPSSRGTSRSGAATKRVGASNAVKHRGGALLLDATRRLSLDVTRRRRLRNKHQDHKSAERDLEAVPVDPTFQASMMAKVEQEAARDPSIAAVLAAAKTNPNALVAAAQNDPAIVKSLAAFFVREIANDRTTAVELAKVYVASSAPAVVPSRGGDARIVSSDSDNVDLSSDSSSDEESLC